MPARYRVVDRTASGPRCCCREIADALMPSAGNRADETGNRAGLVNSDLSGMPPGRIDRGRVWPLAERA
ncbi:hypothetical protein LG3211_1154 [Lysobacter gummosus]|jgi:hypothetical protein|nr:hypothetical protein LG3211_1154 [Lysobacter gummosus]